MNLFKLPKTDLHRHIEGAVRFSTAVEIAKSLKIDLPYTDEKALRESFLITSPMKNLKSVLDKFELTRSLLGSEEVLERVAFECIEDAFLENIELIELRYSPSFVQSKHQNLSYEKIQSAIFKGLNNGLSKYPNIKSGLIGIIGRIDDVKTQEQVVNFIIDHKSEFLGIDLADNEVAGDMNKLSPLFQKAKSEGLHITIHAGEAPGTAQNVKVAIEKLGAERIGHGLQIWQHPELIQLVKTRGIHLELCPYSNYLTNAITSLDQHPFKKLMDDGVSVSINSDDPGIFGSSLTQEYEILQKYFNFSENEFNKCNQMAHQASFIRK